MAARFDRQIRFFGEAGQRAIADAKVGIVGCGGNGSHVLQQLAYLGVTTFVLVDPDVQTDTSLNRNIGAVPEDVDGSIPKVDTSKRLIQAVQDAADVRVIRQPLATDKSFSALRDMDVVFGCVDDDAVRFVLNEFCLAYGQAYYDLASEIIASPDGSLDYGGRVVVTTPSEYGCLQCRSVLDDHEVHRGLAGQAVRDEQDALYGVPATVLDSVGPSVVSINGVVASLAVTEFMLNRTNVRNPNGYLIYRGVRGGVTIVSDPPQSDCHYCINVKGKGISAGVERYLST